MAFLYFVAFICLFCLTQDIPFILAVLSALVGGGLCWVVYQLVRK